MNVVCAVYVCVCVWPDNVAIVSILAFLSNNIRWGLNETQFKVSANELVVRKKNGMNKTTTSKFSTR